MSDHQPEHLPVAGLDRVVRFLVALEKGANSVIGAMGCAAGVVTLVFAAWFWSIDERRVSIGLVVFSANLLIVGAACLAGAWIKTRRIAAPQLGGSRANKKRRPTSLSSESDAS